MMHTQSYATWTTQKLQEEVKRAESVQFAPATLLKDLRRMRAELASRADQPTDGGPIPPDAERMKRRARCGFREVTATINKLGDSADVSDWLRQAALIQRYAALHRRALRVQARQSKAKRSKT